MKYTQFDSGLYEVILEEPEFEHFIYVLTDPVSTEIMYVGKSNNPFSRLKSHIFAGECRQGSDRTFEDVAQWVSNLLKQGLQPRMFVIEEVGYGKGDREKYWIQYFLDCGASLLNKSKVSRT